MKLFKARKPAVTEQAIRVYLVKHVCKLQRNWHK